MQKLKKLCSLLQLWILEYSAQVCPLIYYLLLLLLFKKRYILQTHFKLNNRLELQRGEHCLLDQRRLKRCAFDAASQHKVQDVILLLCSVVRYSNCISPYLIFKQLILFLIVNYDKCLTVSVSSLLRCNDACV